MRARSGSDRSPGDEDLAATAHAWAASTHLGCGISVCPGLTLGHSVVCDYGPGGNDGGARY